MHSSNRFQLLPWHLHTSLCLYRSTLGETRRHLIERVNTPSPLSYILIVVVCQKEEKTSINLDNCTEQAKIGGMCALAIQLHSPDYTVQPK